MKEKFSFKLTDKDRSCAIYTCNVPDCTWRLRANETHEGDISITILSPCHTCLLGEIEKRYSVSGSLAWLRRHIPKHLNITAATKPREIIECLRIQYGETVSYKAALRAKTSLMEDTIDEQRNGFRCLPAYVSAIQAANPEAFIKLSVDHQTNLFQWIFVCPAQSKTSFFSCHRFIAVDGTFLKTRFVQTLLLAVTIDANGHYLLLAWAIV